MALDETWSFQKDVRRIEKCGETSELISNQRQAGHDYLIRIAKKKRGVLTWYRVDCIRRPVPARLATVSAGPSRRNGIWYSGFWRSWRRPLRGDNWSGYAAFSTLKQSTEKRVFWDKKWENRTTKRELSLWFAPLLFFCNRIKNRKRSVSKVQRNGEMIRWIRMGMNWKLNDSRYGRVGCGGWWW